MKKDKKIILDACCGSRMFWFDKEIMSGFVYRRGILPTPVAVMDGAYADKNPDSKRRSKSIATLAWEAAGGKTSQLNPLFVAEMMSFPADWTVLPFQSGGKILSKPTEMQ